MCGIAGVIGKEDELRVRRMIAQVKHRGPDNTGILVRDGVSLAHARLSVIDTSTNANQPMLSDDEGTVIVFNGEIYNFSELRLELENDGVIFSTASDTEVILALYKKKGESCFLSLSGMFAIALYDFSNNTLLLARDRMGEKPLYWTEDRGDILFGSELGALLVSGMHHKEVSLSALVTYLQLDYVPTPNSIIKNVHKVAPGTVVTFKDRHLLTTKTFWSPPRTIKTMSITSAVNELDSLLSSTVARELVSDVPLGVFLSGGLDSSTIAYYAQKASINPIHTFSIGFDEPDFDESSYAREVAGHIGSIHHEKIVRAEDALALIQDLPNVLSEPVADASIIPTLLLSKFARESVTVALGGDGGDELFAGYPTFSADLFSSLYRKLPSVAQRGIFGAVQSLPASEGNFSPSYALRKLVASTDSNPIHRHMEWLGSFGRNERRMLAGPLLLDAARQTDVFEHVDTVAEKYSQNSQGNRLLFAYARSYLMDEVLVKVDRASMYHSLETRAPFLDHSLVEFVFSLPYEFKYRHGTSKYLLKQLMKDTLPSRIVNRKKKGFGIPLARWLRGPLQELCRDTLSEHKIRNQGLFNHTYVQKLIDDHMKGDMDNRKELWNLIIFQLWRDRWAG